MYVVFRNSHAIACFEDKDAAVSYWREHGGTIILYPDMSPTDIIIW